ncbi:MAG: trypsin-like peptidase domain-containing protein [Salibacteraceae bacterium]
MKSKIQSIAIALVSAVIATTITVSYLHSNFEKQIELLTLKQTQQANENHLVSYGLPVESVDFVEAAEKTVNAVVHVKTIYQLDGGYYTFDPIRHFFFGDGIYPRQPRYGAGAGSGVIISPDGYIVTNNLVINGASKIEVSLNDNRSFEAEIVGQDPSTDLALLKIDAKDLPTITFGNSDHVRVGEWVLAVGNPFNLESTVTAGIVSAKGRDINILANGPDGVSAVESFIQTDAAVNPGNSGGALVNARGELIGINAAIKSNTGSYAGYSFAIPVNIVNKVVEDLLKYGAVQRGFLGVTIINVDQNLKNEKNLKTNSGVYVAEAIEKGAAREAGIEAGDVIVAIGNKEIKTITEFQEVVSLYRPGDKIVVKVNRNGKMLEYPVTLRNRFGEAEISPKKELDLQQKLAATFVDLGSDELEKYGISGGVRVKELGRGKLQSAGIMPDFIITKVDQTPIMSKEQLLEVLKNKSGGVLIEGIYPNGKRAYYGFGL